MLLKAIMPTCTTDKDYKKVLNKRISLLYIMISLGVITVALSFIFSNGKYNYLPDFLSGFYTGIGSALIAIGLVFIMKIKNILKNEKKLKEKRLEEQDERNQMILQRAMSLTAKAIIVIAYIGLLISGIFNLIVFYTLFVIILVYIVIFALSHMYYKTKL